MLNRILIVFGAFLLVFPAGAQLSLEPIVTGLTTGPLFVTHAPGDPNRLFVVTRRGQILIVKNGGLESTPFLDIGTKVTVGGETGLLCLAFHPDYRSNGYFYVNYNPIISGQLKTHIARYRVLGDPATSDVVDPNSESVLIAIDQPFSNHNGGMIAFGPNDGYLYIATGDGGSGNDPLNNAQSLNTMLGKLLRIDVDLLPENVSAPNGLYAIPADNPFLNTPGASPEIWAYGLRNPWRFSFDRANGDLYIGDVGQNAREELDYQAAASAGGENYGWRIFEGTRCNTTVSGVTQATCDALVSVPPIHEYVNPTEGQAIMGGYVYRGSAIAGLQGTYFFADAGHDRVWSLRYDGANVTEFAERTSELDPPHALGVPVSFGEDLAGELYLVDLTGSVYRIVGPAAGEGAFITGPGSIEDGETGRLHVYVPNQIGPVSYAWTLNDVPLSNTGADLLIDGATPVDAGYYVATASTGAKTVYTTPPFYVSVVPAGSLPVGGMVFLAGCGAALALLAARGYRAA